MRHVSPRHAAGSLVLLALLAAVACTPQTPVTVAPDVPLEVPADPAPEASQPEQVVVPTLYA